MRHGETMRYLSTTAAQRVEMLRTIGVGDVEALIERIPPRRGSVVTWPSLPRSRRVSWSRTCAPSPSGTPMPTAT